MSYNDNNNNVPLRYPDSVEQENEQKLDQTDFDSMFAQYFEVSPPDVDAPDALTAKTSSSDVATVSSNAHAMLLQTEHGFVTPAAVAQSGQMPVNFDAAALSSNTLAVPVQTRFNTVAPAMLMQGGQMPVDLPYRHGYQFNVGFSGAPAQSFAAQEQQYPQYRSRLQNLWRYISCNNSASASMFPTLPPEPQTLQTMPATAPAHGNAAPQRRRGRQSANSTKPRPHKCQWINKDGTRCTSAFTRKSDLKRHDCSHTGKRNFHCATCHKKFLQSSALTVHSRIHTGEKPYLCAYCDSRFADSSSKARHEKAHKRKGHVRKDEVAGVETQQQ